MCCLLAMICLNINYFVSGASSQVKSNLEEVDYSSRYALGLFFDKGVKLDEPWSGKYVNDHPIFRFIAIDNKKRGQGLFHFYCVTGCTS